MHYTDAISSQRHVDDPQEGERVFSHVCLDGLRLEMRYQLDVKGERAWNSQYADENDAARPGSCCLHDFRWVHALDLAVSGCSLHQILQAVCVSAFLPYLRKGVVIQGHLDDSTGDDNELCL